MATAIEEAIEASRRAHPELWEKADRIAEIIEPSAFAEWYSGISGEKREPTTRQRYLRASARRRAWEVLRYLGIAPEDTDWAAIFEEMSPRPTDQQGGSDG